LQILSLSWEVYWKWTINLPRFTRR
jgi:hypothetical protein